MGRDPYHMLVENSEKELETSCFLELRRGYSDWKIKASDVGAKPTLPRHYIGGVLDNAITLSKRPALFTLE